MNVLQIKNGKTTKIEPTRMGAISTTRPLSEIIENANYKCISIKNKSYPYEKILGMPLSIFKMFLPTGKAENFAVITNTAFLIFSTITIDQQLRTQIRFSELTEGNMFKPELNAMADQNNTFIIETLNGLLVQIGGACFFEIGIPEIALSTDIKIEPNPGFDFSPKKEFDKRYDLPQTSHIIKANGKKVAELTSTNNIPKEPLAIEWLFGNEIIQAGMRFCELIIG